MHCPAINSIKNNRCAQGVRPGRALGRAAWVWALGLTLLATTAAAAAVPHLDPARDSARLAGAADAVGAGFVPPAFATDHYAAAVESAAKADKVLPAVYDARALGWVSAVKDQEDCGACYAFSSAADLESKVLRAGEGAYDLSENGMKECHYQDSSCSGGNQYQIMNYLATTGAVLEACDPYVSADVGCTIGCARQFVVLDFRAISGGTVPATAVLKQYLTDHGPLHTTFFAGDATQPAWLSTVSNYNGTGALYFTGTNAPNHSVVIVGWDDTITHPGGSGAWIVKNSWGTNWGGTCGYGSEPGYFYIAYGSASIGMYSSFVQEYMHQDDDTSLLYHDEGGYTAAFGGLGTVMWGLASYTAPANTKLHRVEFWTTDATVDVDVYLYESFVGGSLSGLLASSLDNAFTEPGYHHVELATPLPLAAGQEVHISVRLENATYTYPLAADGDGVVDAGKSWYSFNGSTWGSLEPYAVDVTIRARTSVNAVLAIDGTGDDPDLEPLGGDLPRELAIDSAWPNPFNPATNITYHLPRSGPATVTVYDLKGRQVRTLIDGSQEAGSRTVVWDGRDDSGVAVPSGVYFCQVQAVGQVRGIKLALLK